MLCPCCLRARLKFVCQGRLEFDTDSMGRPTGEATVSVADGRGSLECPACGRAFPVRGWDRNGRTLLEEETLVRQQRIVIQHARSNIAERSNSEGHR